MYPPMSMGATWRVNTFGDPLMLSAPPEKMTKPREPGAADYGVHLGDAVKDMMRACTDDDTGEKIAEAMRALELLDRDDLVVKLWTLAEQKQLTAPAARAASGALFRFARR
jgi:hypothetical protein